MSRTTKKKTRSKKRYLSEVEHHKIIQFEINWHINNLMNSMAKTKKIESAYEKKFGKSKGTTIHIRKPKIAKQG